MVLELRRRAVDVKVMSGLADILGHKTRVERLADVPVLCFERDTLYPLNATAKRGLDLVGAAVLIVLGAVPAVLYWAAARLRGVPMFRYERRLGRDACPIDLPVVHETQGLVPSDFVNLPAWVAVLRGRLSLVGPYPLPPEAAADLAEWQRLRFSLRPGITGYWRTLRPEETDLESVVRLDIFYMQNWSIGLDFRLLLQSLGNMLLGRGARLNLGPNP
jgi:lipopolysaccharide/colanic/teichoic acid biosynthesis glycosyltransferase